ncbi:hypothetical protein E4T39_02735 [Aureobasidium subglaciale]|nr:hypothetical protein E4T39_02735 [Aureobasidium subglaciale]
MPARPTTLRNIYLLVTAAISAICCRVSYALALSALLALSAPLAFSTVLAFDFGSVVTKARRRLKNRRRSGRSSVFTPTEACTTPHLPSTERRQDDGGITARQYRPTATADRSPVFIPHHTDHSGQERCCVSKETHEFRCSSLDMDTLPPAFKTMLEIIQHILSYVFIGDALQSLGDLADACSLIDGGRPKPPRLMAMGLDWDSSCARPFLRALLQFAGLENRVVCVKVSEQDKDSATRDGEVDILLCLKGSRWRPRATRCTASDIIPICPIVVRDGPNDNLIGRLREWLGEHFECLEENRIAQESRKWPIPYFVLDGDKWSFGFAIKHDSRVELHDQTIGSMGWDNGVEKLIVVLRCVIESTDTRYREWYYERPPRTITRRVKKCVGFGQNPGRRVRRGIPDIRVNAIR